MNKTKELVTTIAPGVGIGLLALYAAGLLSIACLANAAAIGAGLLAAIGVAAVAVDVARSAARKRGCYFFRAPRSIIA